MIFTEVKTKTADNLIEKKISKKDHFTGDELYSKSTDELRKIAYGLGISGFDLFTFTPYVRRRLISEILAHQMIQEKISSHKKNVKLLERYAKWNDSERIWVTKKVRKLLAVLKSEGIVERITKHHYPVTYWMVSLTDGGIVKVRMSEKEDQPQPESEPPQDYCGENAPEENTMQSKGKKSFTQQLKSDAEQTAYRQGARKATNMTHGFILYVFHKYCNFDDSKLAVLKDILESDVGKALLKYGMGQGIGHLPFEHEVLENMASEFRIQGMDDAAEAGLAKVVEVAPSVMPAVMQLAQTISAVATGEKGMVEIMQAFKSVDGALPEDIKKGIEDATKRANNYVRVEVSTPGPIQRVEVQDEVVEAEVEQQSEEDDCQLVMFNRPASVMQACCA